MPTRFALPSFLAASIILAPTALAQLEPITRETIVGPGVLSRPVFVTHAPGDHTRIFIVEQRSGSTGRVRAFDITTNTFLDTAADPFLEVAGVNTQNEQGLLGLAFHPSYAENGYLFVYFTNQSSGTVLRRYTVSENDPNWVDPTTRKTILTFAQPFSNHNGGWIGFGLDGYLYIASGDGGSGGDPQNHGQNTNTLLGAMLRIDIDVEDDNDEYNIPPDNPFVGVSGRDEIWSYGLRNPWRASFDRDFGDLYIADVGQGGFQFPGSGWEEINFQHADSAGGENWGWRCYEGNFAFNTGGCPPQSQLKFPFHVYGISGNPRCAIVGGFVYRGCDVPTMRGRYFFADYCPGHVLSLVYDRDHVPAGTTGGMSDLIDHSGTLGSGIGFITSFGEDAAGELYFTSISAAANGVYKIVPVNPSVQPADLNCDGVVNVFDLLELLAQWGDCPGCKADLTGNGVVNVFDLLELLSQWG